MTIKTRPFAKLAAGMALVALLGAACGDMGGKKQAAGEVTHSTEAHGSTAAGAGGADTPAAGLRAGLTALLQEHVYLAGIATGTALGGGDLAAPAATLDKNSVALSEAIGSVYGDAAGKQFLDLWRKHIGFFVDYTTGVATKDQAKADGAKAALDGYRADFGAFLASANPNLTKEAVAEELKPHVQTLVDAIDAQAAKSPEAFDKLRTAASHMPMTADIIAGAIVKQFPDKFAG
jgi:hypothetical protein